MHNESECNNDNTMDMEELMTSGNKTNKPEPFFLKTEGNWRDHIKTIENLLKRNLILKVVGDFVKFNVNDIAEFRQIQALLSKTSVKFYAMNPRCEKPIKILIRGIHKDISTDEIHVALENSSYLPIRVTQLIRLDRASNIRIKLPLFYAM